MRRRDFIALAAVTAAVPAAVRAQQTMPVIGYLNSQSPASFARFVTAFREGLRQAGYVEGQNLVIEYRWAEGDRTRLAPMAADLVRRQVAVIGTGGGPAPALAAKAATDTIPIVFNVGGNPIELGLVASLNHPGGNITGVNILSSELDGKRLDLLRQLVPGAGRIAVLQNPNNPNAAAQLQEVETAAGALGQQITILRATDASELDAALGQAPEGADAWLVVPDPFFNSNRERIVNAIARLRLPAIYEQRDFAAAGGLISYGTSVADGYRQVGVYVGKILAGANPADLPVVQSSRFELAINLKTAKALGLTVPPILLAQADEVIE
jgi:putative ABC transport system substrate-binding protein